MECAYIGVPFRIKGYIQSGDSEDFIYTWFWVQNKKVTYGTGTVTDRDIVLTSEEQFYQAITLVELGFTDKETLQQLLGL